MQTWTFGDALAMINLGGEIVVDYSVRLKNEPGGLAVRKCKMHEPFEIDVKYRHSIGDFLVLLCILQSFIAFSGLWPTLLYRNALKHDIRP